MNDLNIETLLTLPKKCIYGFVNDQDKAVWLGYTTNLLVALERNIARLKTGVHEASGDLSKLRFAIIETISNEQDIRLQYGCWVNLYRNKGYKLYRSFNAKKFRVKYDFSTSGVVVYLVSPGYNKLEVGRFNTLENANLFVNRFYPDSDNVYSIVKLSDVS